MYEKQQKQIKKGYCIKTEERRWKDISFVVCTGEKNREEKTEGKMDSKITRPERENKRQREREKDRETEG